MIDQHGFVKLIDSSLINYGETGYSRAMFTGKYRAALSPKLMHSLKYKELKPVHDPSKSDIFSIGITTLCAALNNKLDDFYDWSKGVIEWDSIKMALIRMNELGFSKQLIGTVEGMLKENESQRIGCDELNYFLEEN